VEQVLLDSKQAATLTGLSASWFERRRCTGTPEQPPYIRIGRNIRYERGALLRWFQSRVIAPGET
jgi:predicted DNA-binding transcriptional regulator AlpA